MQSKSLPKLTVPAVALALTLSMVSLAAVVKPVNASAGGNGLIVPLYGWNSNYEQLISAKSQNPAVPIIAVINPSNGPGSAADPHWTDIVGKLHAANIQVAGYVPTDYGNQPLTAAESQTDSYFAWYGVDGVFYDNTSPSNYPYYKTLTDHVKSSNSARISILNPGALVPQSYADAADVIIVYENGVIPSGIAANGIDASRLGVLVHDVPDSGTVFTNVHQQAKYIYSSLDWSQVAQDILQQAARMK